MPMKRENYPKDWEKISARIRFDRAGGRCEFIMEDGRRCPAVHGWASPITGAKVVLTTAHLLDPNPMNCADDNLMAMCQLHHLRYDAPRRNRHKKGQNNASNSRRG